MDYLNDEEPLPESPDDSRPIVADDVYEIHGLGEGVSSETLNENMLENRQRQEEVAHMNFDAAAVQNDGEFVRTDLRGSLFKRARALARQSHAPAPRIDVPQNATPKTEQGLANRVAGYSFGMLSEDDVLAMSVVEVSSDKVFEPKSNRVQDGGMLDLHMGPSDTNQKEPCKTCAGYLLVDQSMNSTPENFACPGHFGHVNGNAVFKSTQMSDTVALLRSMCFNCFRSPLDDDDMTPIINEALQCQPDGTPFNRKQRIKIVSKRLASVQQCFRCKNDIRCEVCAQLGHQCDECSSQCEFRPKIVKGECQTFPYHIAWHVKTTPKNAATIERLMICYKTRHGIKSNDFALNPEMARSLLLNMDPRLAVLFIERLPNGPFRPASYSLDPLERIFGKQDNNRRLIDASGDFKQFVESLISRVLPLPPPMNRNGRSDNDGTESLHEQTQRLLSVVRQNNHILAIGSAEASASLQRLNDKRARDAEQANLPKPEPLVDSTPADRANILRYRTGVPWHALDQVLHQREIGLAYSDYQLLYILWMAPHHAKRWRSVNSKIKLPASALDTSPHAKDKVQAPTTLQDNKHGRFRGNLLGKRVDFSSRSVITGDPNLDIDQVAIPRAVAAVITVPETLSSYNMERVLREAQARADSTDDDILRMPIRPQLYLWNADKTRKIDYMKFTRNKKIAELPFARQLGATVERPLRDGDIVVFNRAPSLHRQSLLGHRVVLWDGPTFKFHPSVTTFYNADYDGDEMNVHKAQDLVTDGEIQVLMAPSSNVLLSRNSSPHIGLMQDFLLGAWLLGSKDALFSREEAMSMLYIGDMTSRLPPDDDPHGDKKSSYCVAPRYILQCTGCPNCNASIAAELDAFDHKRLVLCNGTRLRQNQVLEPTKSWFPTPAVMARCRGCDRCKEDATAQEKRCCGDGWIRRWTGKQLASFALPTWFNSQTVASPGDAELNFTPPMVDPNVRANLEMTQTDIEEREVRAVEKQHEFKKNGEPIFIRNGQFLTGTFKKSTVGACTNGLIHQMLTSTSAPSGDDSAGMVSDRGRHGVRLFIRTLGRMGVHLLTTTGFSIGPEDMMAQSEKIQASINLVLYGVERDSLPPAIPDGITASQYRRALRDKDPTALAYQKVVYEADPVAMDYPRFDLAKHDRRAPRKADLERLGIKYKPNQPGVERQVAKLIQDHYKSEAKIGKPNVERTFEQTLDVSVRIDHLETRIQNAQAAARKRAADHFVGAMNYSNGQFVMAIVGTKGDEGNIASCGVAVGSQDISGKRLTNQTVKGFDTILDDEDSTSGDQVARMAINPLFQRLLFNLPHGYAGADAGAFVFDSYIGGLTALEMFFHAMASREGLIDTAQKTGESGYLQRKMSKEFEAMKRAADDTVRDDANRIINISSGGRPFSQQFLRWMTCEPLAMDTKSFRECGLLDPAADHVLIALRSGDVERANTLVRKEALLALDIVAEIRAMPDYNSSGAQLRVIGDLTAIIRDVMIDAGYGDRATTGTLPYHKSVFNAWHLDRVYRDWYEESEKSEEGSAATNRLNVFARWYLANTSDVIKAGDTPLTVEYLIERVQRWLSTDLAPYDYITRAMVFLRLTAKQAVLRHQLTVNTLEMVIERYNRQLAMSRSVHGEPIGCEAAQSIGEPATQMTLKTFHMAGSGNKLVYAGIPRIKEIIDCSWVGSMKCPIVKTRIRPSISTPLLAEIAIQREFLIRSRVDPTEFIQSRLALFGHGAISKVIDAYATNANRSVRQLINDTARIGGAVKRAKGRKNVAETAAKNEVLSTAIGAYNARVDTATESFVTGVVSACGNFGATLGEAFDHWVTSSIGDAAKSLGVVELDRVTLNDMFAATEKARKSVWLLARTSEQLRRFFYDRVHAERDLRRHVRVLSVDITEKLFASLDCTHPVIVVPLFTEPLSSNESLLDENVSFVGIGIIAPYRSPDTMTSIYDTIRRKRWSTQLAYNDIIVSSTSAEEVDDLTRYFSEVMSRFVDIKTSSSNETLASIANARANTEIEPLIRDFRITTIGSISYSNNVVEYAPLVVGGAHGLHLKEPIAYESEIEKATIESYHAMVDDDYGCRDPSCVCARQTGAHNQPVADESLLKKFGYCNDTRCLGSMALIIRLDAKWFKDTRFNTAVLQQRLVKEIGEKYCSVLVLDGELENRVDIKFITVLIRIHTCKLDELRQRNYGSANPALVPVIIHDKSMLPEVRTKQTKADRLRARAWRFETDKNGTTGDTSDPYYLDELRVERGLVESFDFSGNIIGLIGRLEEEYRRQAAMYRNARDGTEQSQIRVKLAIVIAFLRDSYKYAGDIGLEMISDLYEQLTKSEKPAESRNGESTSANAPMASLSHIPNGTKFLERRTRQTVTTQQRIESRRQVFTPELLNRISAECVTRHEPDITLDGRTHRIRTSEETWGFDPTDETRTARIHEQREKRFSKTARRRKVFDPQLLKTIVKYFADEYLPNPLASVSIESLKPVTVNMIRDEHMQIRTEIEIYELMRISVHLNTYVFTGERGAHTVEREEVPTDSYTPEGGHEPEKQSMAFIDSRNFRSILSYRGIDVRETTTTSIRCVSDVLGIEAGRNSIIIELWQVLATSNSSTSSNYCNFALVADVQTHTGSLMPLSRAGIHAHVNDTLQIASNEEQSVQTSAAGIAGRYIAEIVSPSSAMMLAPHKIGFGTATVELLLDVSKLFEAIPPKDFDIEIDHLFPLPVGSTAGSTLFVPPPATTLGSARERFRSSVIHENFGGNGGARRFAPLSATSASSAAPATSSPLDALDEDTMTRNTIRNLKINPAFLRRLEENDDDADDKLPSSTTKAKPVPTVPRIEVTPAYTDDAEIAIPVSQGLSKEKAAIVQARRAAIVTQDSPSIAYDYGDDDVVVGDNSLSSTAAHKRSRESDDIPANNNNDDGDGESLISERKSRRVQSVFQQAMQRQRDQQHQLLSSGATANQWRALSLPERARPQIVPTYEPAPQIVPGYDPAYPAYTPTITPALVVNAIVDSTINNAYDPLAPDPVSISGVRDSLVELQAMLGGATQLGSRRLDRREFLKHSLF